MQRFLQSGAPFSNKQTRSSANRKRSIPSHLTAVWRLRQYLKNNRIIVPSLLPFNQGDAFDLKHN